MGRSSFYRKGSQKGKEARRGHEQLRVSLTSRLGYWGVYPSAQGCPGTFVPSLSSARAASPEDLCKPGQTLSRSPQRPFLESPQRDQ